MPTAPFNTKCRELGCNNPKTSRSSFCSLHGGGMTLRKAENNQLYNQSFWKRQRQKHLGANPLCVACLLEGKVVQAEHVDHVFPHRQNPERFKRNVFQSLCHSHHTMKTHMEARGTYLYYTPKGVRMLSDSDYPKILNE
jgi:hypothetical protein